MAVAVIAASAMRFQSAVAHELFSDLTREMVELYRGCVFQSAVAHELFSDPVAAAEAAALQEFQSAVAHELFSDPVAAAEAAALQEFQSAVAHELFSDPSWSRSRQCRSRSFKALSRMSSSPTRVAKLRRAR